MRRILGISAFYHDSAAALLEDGRLTAAAQEERFTRQKHDAGFPIHAVGWILEDRGLTMGEIDAVVFYEKPFVKFERLLETFLAMAPQGFPLFHEAMPRWTREKLFQKGQIADELKSLPGGDRWNERLGFCDHHLSHAASTFYTSPFENAAILTVDGVGEWATTTVAHGRGRTIETLAEQRLPHSLGLFYSAISTFLGFKVNSGEYKVMGLAPYGRPRFAELMADRLIDLRNDGSFRLDMDWFDFATQLRMYSPRMADLFGCAPREPEGPLEQIHMDIAASLQVVTNRAMVGLARHAAELTGEDCLCLAGGVALNCVANRAILADGRIRRIWLPSAPGDAGGAAGAAMAFWHMGEESPRPQLPGEQVFLGPVFSQQDVIRRLDALGAVYEVETAERTTARTAQDLGRGLIVGWMQGRAEFGPRALGNRSILADPRIPDLQKTLNLKIKFRESFRPFAPSVLAEAADEWFADVHPSPFMSVVAHASPGRGRAVVPAVTHLDETARLQTVEAEANPRFHELLSAFAAETGCPMLVNTSFNVRGEPIVLTPEDAFNCFMETGIDRLVIGDVFLHKEDQPDNVRALPRRQFAPD
ncbi:carbamoyltransferase family protein [Consotaella aegiceratis]|uniref:carbamoyltransferase family protein n=1 Tax=Consotaella aegiceratis TaxID=3097961 RepID=UPI002F413D9D